MSESRPHDSLEPRDIEAIAAFLDGELTEPERQALLERLDREPPLYEVFVEATRDRDRESAEGGQARVVRHPAARRRYRLWARAAALLALAVAAPLLFWPRGPLTGPRLARGLTADGRLDGRLGSDWFEQGWSVMRGISPGTGEADTAFRVGVRTVDLDVALRQAQRAEGREKQQLEGDAERLTYRLEALLRDVEFSEPVQLSYASVREQLAGGALDEALALTRAVDPYLDDIFAELAWAYRFGQWCEAGKLAAQSGDTSLLGSRAFRRTGRGFAAEDLDEEPAARLTEIDAALAAPAAEMDLAALAAAFTAIIDES